MSKEEQSDVNPRSEPSRRGFIRGVGTGLAGAPALRASRSGKLPNILYIHSHDSGRYLQPYGHFVPTPNLKRLASEGVLFRRAFSAAPTCSPSRAALLTGQCPHQNGMLGLAHRGFALNDYRQHLLYTLREAGYRSTLAGLQHIAAHPDQIGYDEVFKPKSYHTVDVTPGAVRFLNDKPSQPFFLNVGFFETHREYPPPTAQDDARFIQPPAPLPDTPKTRADMASYHASARLLDNAVGEVLEALARNGLAENTLVLSTTDHGIAFPLMKCNLLDFGFGVSMILRGPGGFGGGRVCDAMISQIDVFPTICEWLGLQPPGWLEGRSFLPVLRGEKKETNDQIFAEVTYHAAYEPKRCVRTQRWKYIRRYGDRHTPVLPNCDDSPSKSLWLEYGWRQRPVDQEDLYDLVFDPGEHHNLALNLSENLSASPSANKSAKPAERAILEEMRNRLDSWMSSTHDPLLRRPVAAPHGARVNNPDGVSPKEPAETVD